MTRERDPGQWWTEAWSPVTGCTPAGAGCDHCWARTMVRRFETLHMPGCHLETADGARHEAFSHVVCHPDRLDKPLHWRKPRVVLVSMLGDLFHEQVPNEFLWRILTTVSHAEEHQFCALTKRPERASRFMSAGFSFKSALPNLFLMASVWDQPSADAACEAFAQMPAGVRWGLHVEPMLGPVVLDEALYLAEEDGARPHRLSWCVVGGENGPGARPMDPQWALDLREQCRAAGVPFWFKGWGSAMRKLVESVMGPTLSGLEQTREVPW